MKITDFLGRDSRPFREIIDVHAVNRIDSIFGQDVADVSPRYEIESGGMMILVSV